MTVCEMCGKNGELLTADVEGVELKVCSSCAKYGKVKKSYTPVSLKQKDYTPKELPQFRVVDNFSFLLKSAREKKGMKQEDFAKLINERESILAKWEQGSLKPDVDVARRLERILGLILVEIEEEISFKPERLKTDGPTLGDVVKIRKRK